MAGLVIPAIVALVIGAGGGYAAARFLSGVSESDIAQRDKRIAELDKTLSEMKFDSQGAATQQSTLQQRVKDLQAQVDQLKRTKESLRIHANQQDAKAKDDAAAEIAALKKTIEEAGDLSAELTRARKSMKVSELQTIELEKTVSDQKAQIGKLQAAADQVETSVSPSIVLLQGQKATLQAELDKARNAAADVPSLKSRIAALEDQIAKASDDADRKAAQITALQKQKDDLRAGLDAANRARGDASRQAQTIAGLQKQLDDMAESLGARDDDARKAGDRIKALTDENAALTRDSDALRKQVALLNDKIAALKTTPAPADDQAPASNDTTGDQESTGLTPRNSDDVRKAIANLPGFDGLAADKQAVLVDMLEKGACITDALKAAYGHVSPISLRSLFRDLGGSC